MNKLKYIFFLSLLYFLFSCSENVKKDSKEKKNSTAKEYCQIGIANFASSKYYLALENFNKALEIDSLYTSALISRGCTKAKLNDFLGAIQDFDKSIFIEINDTIAYLNRGTAKTKLKLYNSAIDDFNKAIELDINYADAYKARGITELLMHQKTRGCLDLSKAGELGSTEAYSFIKQFCN